MISLNEFVGPIVFLLIASSAERTLGKLLEEILDDDDSAFF